MKRLFLLLGFCLLAACARPAEEFVIVDPVPVEPITEAPSPERAENTDCGLGDGDGIGGTGCPID